MPPNSLYPAQIDNATTLPTAVDLVTPVSGSVTNSLRQAILNIQTELGVKPSSVYGTVRNRLDVIESILIPGEQGGSGLFKAGGDLGGNGNSQIVIGIQTVPVSSTHPSDGYLLTYSSSLAQWYPAPPPVSFTAGNDLSGTNTFQTVSGLYNHPLASTAPVASAVPVYNTTLLQYDVRKLTLDDVGPAFAINSFTGGSIVECGATVTNPAFTASYSSPASSAQITNTDNIDSPLVLSSPYTSGTVVGSFSKAGVNASTTFTLTATAATTKTANQSITWEARSFGGVGAAGATSASASGSNALLNNGATLNSLGLHSSDTGQNYGPFSPSSQKIYLLLIGGSHTFKDQNGFSFAMNAPTNISFTNQNGAVLSMFLYESTNLLATSFTLSVVS